MRYNLNGSKPAKTKSLNLKVDEQVELVPLPDILFCYINFFCPSVLMIWLSALQ